MTNILYRTDSILAGISDRIRKNKKRETIVGVGIYTVLFALYFSLTLLTPFIMSGSLLEEDGISQYYPFLIEFKRTFSEFFDSFASGTPTYPALEYNFAYGSDMTTTIFSDFIPFLPYFIFSLVVPYEGLGLFYGIGTVVFSYIRGLTFLYLCRYFKLDMLVSGLFAPLYVFSGSYFFTIAVNQQFLLMTIAFPLFTVGIDRIVNKRSPVLFILTVFWVSLSGIVYLIYTIPFIVLFALIRVRFVYKENYFKNLGIRFAVGLGSFLFGVLMASFIMLPYMHMFMDNSRLGDSGIAVTELLIPNLDYLKDTLIPSDISGSTGISAVCIPFLIFMLTRVKGKTEEKVYILVMLLLIALPVIRYGLNGFNYSICRWGFIPAELICLLCVRTFDELFSMDKKQARSFAVISLLYTLLVTMDMTTAAVIFLIAAAVFSMIPFLGKLVSRIWEKLKALLSDEERMHMAKIVLIIIISVVLLMALAYCVFFGKNYIPEFIVAVVLTVVVAFLSLGGRKKNVISAFLAASLIVVSAVSFSSVRCVCFRIDPLPEYYEKAISDGLGSYPDDNSFGRVALLDETSFAFAEIEEGADDIGFELSESEEDEENTDEQDVAYSDVFLTMSLRENIPEIYTFKSILDKDLIGLEKRAGMDFKGVPSIVEHSGFSANEAFFSLFGIRYMLLKQDPYYFKDINYSLMAGEGDDGRYFCVNERAFPIGVTYSAVSDKERFDSFDPASLAYAMMNEVYLENYSGPITADGSIQYSSRCDSAWEKKLRGAVSYDIECHDNDIRIDDDVSDSFLFITFNGVECRDSTQSPYRDCYIKIDGKKQVTAVIHNSNSSWPWLYTTDHYTIPLGYFKDDVNKISFISPFNYTDGYVSAVPASVYEHAYENATEEVLTDTELSANKLTGNITVSQDKILCVNLMHNNGWKAYVDDAETPIYKANGLFLGIPLKAGTHQIRLEYTTPLIYEGHIVSFISIAAFIVFAVLYGRKNKKAKAENE